MYQGDILPSGKVQIPFNSTDGTGAPVSLAGTPSVAVAKDGADFTPGGTSVVFATDVGSVVGRNLLTVTPSQDPANFTPGSNYSLRMAAGTAGGVSVVGLYLGTFSILNRSNVASAGVAQAGGATTVTLAATASAADGSYVGMLVWIVGGTGAGQARVVTGYVGATKVATVGRAWATNPDATSQYAVLPDQSPKLDAGLRVTAANGGDVLTGETAYTDHQLITLTFLAVIAKTTGMQPTGSGTFHVRNLADDADRVVIPYDNTGNRGAPTITPPSS